MKRNEVDRSKISPMMLHYLELKDKYEDVIVFYRLGDFYEMFFEDAVLVSHELELTLTGRYILISKHSNIRFNGRCLSTTCGRKFTYPYARKFIGTKGKCWMG